MIQSSTFMGLKMLGGKLVKSPWCIEVGGFVAVFAMIFGMIVVGVVGELWKRSRMLSAQRVGVAK